jgi:hypothetical protein
MSKDLFDLSLTENEKTEVEEYINSMLIEEYKPSTIFLMTYVDLKYVLFTLKNPYNFVRYFWRSESEYMPSSSLNSPTRWLFDRISNFGTEITKYWLQKTVSEESFQDYKTKSLNDLSMLYMVENSIIFPDVSFMYCDLLDSNYLIQVLNMLGSRNPITLYQNVKISASEYEVKQQKFVHIEDL